MEGEADFYFVMALSVKHQLDTGWAPFRKNGFASVIKAAKSALAKRGGPPVGIMVDADTSVVKRWQEISDQLSGDDVAVPAKIEVPAEPNPNGTIIEQSGGFPRRVMPDNLSPGELEDFVVTMIPDDDSVWPLSRNYINQIPGGERRFEPDKIDRARLYAWLATCEKPPYIGFAIEHDELDWDSSGCRKLVEWLNCLFA